MCGIIGIATNNPLATSENWVQKGLKKLDHRGPDATGIWASNEKRVTFGHTRLSIIDLDQRSNQPFKRSDLGLVITYNGELYNYKDLRDQLINFGFEFETTSDTEVVLISYSMWGIDCLKRFEGMFSFAIYDQSIDKVVLARDIAGEKPLFYYHEEGNLYFASELKALLHDNSLSRVLDIQSAANYLQLGFVSGKNCIIEGYSKLPPAHYMVFDFETVEVTKYWDLPEYKSTSPSIELLVDRLDKLLRRSIQRMLIADVPIGVLLSGGLDSSLIVAIASDISKEKLHTYTVSFPENASLDESKHAKSIADYFNTTHRVLEVNPNSLIEMLPTICGHYDEPIIDSTMLPTWLVTSMVSKHCKVAIGGDGGDELFGGYKHYSRLALLKSSQVIPATIRNVLVACISMVVPKKFKLTRYIEPWTCDLTKELPIIARYFNTEEIKSLLPDSKLSSLKNHSSVPFGNEDFSSIVQAATRRDFRYYLPEDILVKVDRASMSNSLEMRAPFLSKELIEFAFKDLPPELKASSFDRKILLKQLAKKYLPPEFDYSRKQGFDIPIDSWMRAGELRNLFDLVMFEDGALFDSQFLKSLINRHDDGESNGERLFGLLQFQLWLKKYDIQTYQNI